MSVNLPLCKPFLSGKELAYVTEAIQANAIGTDGQFTERCVALLEQQLGIRKALLTPSCTAALELAALLCDLIPGDEVIMPSYTFVSTANAVMLRGAKPVFVDVLPETQNIDHKQIEDVITARTKAIFVVHYGGVACEMDVIMKIANQHDLFVVEDAAQALNAFYRKKPLGTIGHLGAYSFHTTKNYVCGEGGALCVNDARLIERAEILREKGTNRSQYFRGEVDKYRWVDVGSSYLPSELSCAFLLAQLEAIDEITCRLEGNYRRYYQNLEPLRKQRIVSFPEVPEHCQSNFHIASVLFADGVTRDRVMGGLRERGIGAIFHYVPLHTSPMGKKLGCSKGDFPVTERVSECLLRLPQFAELKETEIDFISQTITELL